MTSSAVLAVDLGGTKSSLGRVDGQGQVSGFERRAAGASFLETADWIAAHARDVCAVGVILPGIYDARRGTAWAPNLWGRDEVPLRDALQARLPVPVVLASDRSGYVLGEQWLGVARGCSDVLFIGVGTGIGVGILSGGHLIEGAHGIAGASGWMALERTWRDDFAACGCWESLAAGPATARRGGVRSAEEVVARARAGDEAAQAVIEAVATDLGLGIANLVSTLDPEIVVLGGGLMQAADLFLPGLRGAVARWAQPVAARLVRIEKTALGADAGLLGAAHLALRSQEILNQGVSN